MEACACCCIAPSRQISRRVFNGTAERIASRPSWQHVSHGTAPYRGRARGAGLRGELAGIGGDPALTLSDLQHAAQEPDAAQRDFAAHAEGLAAEKELGEHGLRICEQLFWAWEIYQHTNDRAELKRAIRKLRRELKAILTRHAGKGARYRRGRRFARNLLNVWPALWTFDAVDGVTPTNNHAERGLRGSVIYRKLSLGSQSEDGERRIERLLSAHTTCRLQHRSLHAYLVDLLSTNSRGDPIPFLA